MLGVSDFILSVYVFLVSLGEIDGTDSAVDVGRINNTCVIHNANANFPANANANAYANTTAPVNANTTAPVNANASTEIKYGSNGFCGCCRQELQYKHSTTYAYDGREFCSITCRKKVSDDDLLALGSSYMNLYIHPVDRAI
jgi:hypothetical protein